MLRKIICGVANHHSSLQLWCLRIKIRVQLQLGKVLLGHHAELRNGTVSQPSVACRAVPFPFASALEVLLKEENLSFLLTLTKRAKNRRFKRNFIKNKSLNVHCNKQAPLCCLTVRNADRETVNMRKSMG